VNLKHGACQSCPELSLSPFFTRQWPSVYEVLEDGRIDIERLRAVFVETLITQRPDDEPIWLGLDSSHIERLEAETSEDHGMIYVPNMPHASKPVSVGWQFSTVRLLPEQPSSWVGILEQRRIRTEQTAIEVGIAQLRAVLPLIQRWIIVLADRWYGGAQFVQTCEEMGCRALIRLKTNRRHEIFILDVDAETLNERLDSRPDDDWGKCLRRRAKSAHFGRHLPIVSLDEPPTQPPQLRSHALL
jgi:hypothetical protein